MENFAKLIHRSHTTYLPTRFPAQFYGLPDGKVYIIFPRFYEIKFQRSGLEYVLAEHLEFQYDYEKEKLSYKGETANGKSTVYPELVDKPNPKFKILKVNREFNSFAEAVESLNKKAKNQYQKIRNKIQVINNTDKLDHLSIA